MSDVTLKIDSAHVMINDRAFRQEVYWDGVPVSKISKAKPGLTLHHRFTVDDPARATIEVMTFEPGGGYLVVKDALSSPRSRRAGSRRSPG